MALFSAVRYGLTIGTQLQKRQGFVSKEECWEACYQSIWRHQLHKNELDEDKSGLTENLRFNK